MNTKLQGTSRSELGERGEAFIGWFRWFGRHSGIWPGILRLSSDQVSVSIGPEGWTLSSVALRRQDVSRITVERWLWTRYVRFVHCRPRVPRVVLFRGGSVEKLLSELRALGYPVA